MTPTSAYRTGREIARGGMGAVLDARDQKLGRSVAMKVMLRRNASEEEQQRFLQEARVLGQLAHPNIVPVHDVGTDEQGRLFYTMKLVQGVTLHDVIGKLKAGDKETLAKYPLNALLTVFQKVCDAVAFAHSRGVIHRDLKPQNIMVGEFGEVLVMDWGLAKILPGSAAAEEAAKTLTLRGQLGQTGPTGTLPLNSPAAEDQATLVASQSAEADATLVAGSSAADDATIAVGTGNASARKLTFGSQDPEPARPSGVYATLEGAVMGTPHFMSPEQAEGKIAELDGRSDIFSLGGILYALLTLRPPVEGDSLEEILSKVRSGTIAPPTAFNAPSTTTQSKTPTTGAVTEPRKIYPLPHCPNGKVPTALSAVTMKALTRDKLRRYQTVAEFTRDIEAYQGGFATSAENADLLTLALLFFRRNKVLASATALVLLVILTALPLVIASERKATANAKTARENEQRAERGEAAAKATLTDLRRTAPVFFAQAKIVLEEGKLADALEKIGYAIQLDDANPDYHLFRAHLRQSAQDLAPAAAGYRRVLALRPADESAKLNLALCEKLLRESGGAKLQLDQQRQLLAALREQKRLVESAPLAALIDPNSATAKAAIIARLREYQKQPGWKVDRVAGQLDRGRVNALPDGTFKVELNGLAIGDLSVLQGQPVSELDLDHSDITDLSNLAGLPLKDLNIGYTKVSDLSPLRGMPVETLKLAGMSVTDLSPLRGMKLRKLTMWSTGVNDLSPLAGMPLTDLDCLDAKFIADLAPLKGAPLVSFKISRGYLVSSIAPLAGAPLKVLRLLEESVSDLSPLAQCPELEDLTLSKLPVTDLTPLARLPLTRLDCDSLGKLADLGPLRGVPLRFLRISRTSVTDLRPLADCPTLEELVLPTQPST